MQSILDGRVPVAGTYSGNSLSVAAGTAVLRYLKESGPTLYSHLESLGRELKVGLEQAAFARGVPIQANHIGSLVQLLLGEISDTQSMLGVNSSDREKVTAVMKGMIRRGVYTHRKGMFFLSAAHTPTDITDIVEAFDASLEAFLSS